MTACTALLKPFSPQEKVARRAPDEGQMKRNPPTSPVTLTKARQLRRDQTDPEKKMWRVLRDRRLTGVKFRRQVPIGPYSADFCCIGRKLIVELDGVYHAETGEHDLRREDFLRTKGFEILRFPCAEVSRNRSKVLDRILQALNAE